ncbi:MAG: ribonuclease Y [bacterium JZ-2024 1]
MTPILWMLLGAFLSFLVLFSAMFWWMSQHKRNLEEGLKKQMELEIAQHRQQAFEDAKAWIEKERKEQQEEWKNRKMELAKEEERLKEQYSRIMQAEKRIQDMEKNLQAKERNLQKEQETLVRDKARWENAFKELEQKKWEIARLTPEEARELILRKTEEDLRKEKLLMLKQWEEEFQKEAKILAQKILVQAMQSLDLPQVVEEVAVTTIPLPSDEMKGRIIGREGRNIRAFEMATGVELIVDDTPEVVMLSSMDPVRRHIAALTLKKLIEDGRIHPGRIEKLVEWARAEVDHIMQEEAQKAVMEVGIRPLHQELMKYLGKMYFRTSYGQNVLHHSVEVALLAGKIAAELGLDVEACRRAGLLHDIGKAMNADVVQNHALEGARLAQECGELPKVVNAIAAHHEEVPFEYPESVVVLVADAVSAVRPGARRESFEKYVQRLKKMEEIARAIEGVRDCYCISAGRELRIIVEPDRVSDLELPEIARKVASQIEKELTFPGQIRVTVIREKRAMEVAR